MIAGFRHKGLKRLYDQDDDRRIRPDLRDKVRRILTLLDAAGNERAMNLPGFNLHPLRGDLKHFWSVTVTGNWRIIFRFEDANATDVDLIDYH